MSRELPELHTDRLILRIGTEADVPAILRFYVGNRAHLTPWWPLFHEAFFTERHWRQIVRVNADDYREDRAARFFLFSRQAPGCVIGLVNLNHISRGVSQSAVLGYGLAESAQGQGLMTEGCRAVVDFGFNRLNLHRITADYVPHNVRSAGVLRRLGFVVEGYARDYLCIDGNWQDHILTGLVNPAWKDPC